MVWRPDRVPSQEIFLAVLFYFFLLFFYTPYSILIWAGKDLAVYLRFFFYTNKKRAKYTNLKKKSILD